MSGETDPAKDPASSPGKAPQPGDAFDFTNDPTQPPGKDPFNFLGDKPKPHVEAPQLENELRAKEDAARRRIAYALITLLAITILLIFVMLFSSLLKVDQIKEFSVLLGPLVTLVSAATGFYYGTKSK
jgi:hypothetical protein